MSLDVYLEVETCPHCGVGEEVYSANITHNLNTMAHEAGIYNLVWRPEENDVVQAWQLIEPLREAIADMEKDPERFKQHNAENGWGLYEHFLPWLRRYLEACECWPQAKVRASR